MKKPNIYIIVSIIVGSIIIGSSIIYANKLVAEISFNQPVNNEKASIIEKDGKEYQILKETPITLTIIDDYTCVECEVDKIISLFKKQSGMPVATRIVSQRSNEGNELIAKYNAPYIPFVIVGDEVEKSSNFSHLTHHVITKSDNGYFVDLDKTGISVGRYLSATYYEKDDPEAPKIAFDEQEYEFGDVSMKNGTVQKEFIIKNVGKNPLELLHLDTSCGCTSVQIELENETSPIFTMAGHGKPEKWQGAIESGKEAKVIVYYDPTVHPDLTGEVTRQAFISTNDPNTTELTFKITLNQTP